MKQTHDFVSGPRVFWPCDVATRVAGLGHWTPSIIHAASRVEPPN